MPLEIIDKDISEEMMIVAKSESINDYEALLKDDEGKDLKSDEKIVERIKSISTNFHKTNRTQLKYALALGFLYQKLRTNYTGNWESQFEKGGDFYGPFSLRSVRNFIRLANNSTAIIKADCLSINRALDLISEIENKAKALPGKSGEVKTEYDFKSRFRKITEDEIENSDEFIPVPIRKSRNGRAEYYTIKGNGGIQPAVKRDGVFYIFNWEFLEQSIK